ncbi:LysR family transcriptional regulator [Heyndrickxia acidicola]|uniref:LysR family transcriptional regulator n=1 Tax=Heyndrickxia acidicola TaxID=209389 RepID=A0ABU6MEZ5_9BACI|nr:LysR family transcriptional regulator [Heyndrickxia acidicola]MED1203245.1 LysR family transcriptional regulator [Heyndrickxia acidicola]
MNLQYLYVFKEVAKWGNFTRTGEELGYAQSSITTQIKKLEDYYQVKLFERAEGRMRLTQQGEELYFYVEKILSLAEEAKEKVSNETNVRGTIRIGTTESLAAYFITPYIKQIKLKHPELKIMLESGLCGKLKESTAEGVYDMAIILDEAVEQPELMTIPVRKEKMVLIAAPGHPYSKLEEMKLELLCSETLILTEEGCSYRTLLEKRLKENKIQPKSVISFSSLEAIKQCAADDLGIALLPEIAVRKELQEGKLIQLPFAEEYINVSIQIIYQKKKWLTPPLKQLLSIIGES